jgi:hypothetical protein
VKQLAERSVAATPAVAVLTSDEEEDAVEEKVEQGVAVSGNITPAAAAAAHARAASLSVRPPLGFAVGKPSTGGIICPVMHGVGLMNPTNDSDVPHNLLLIMPLNFPLQVRSARHVRSSVHALQWYRSVAYDAIAVPTFDMIIATTITNSNADLG